MSIRTNWGYELTKVDALPTIMTVAEFDQLTANKFMDDIRTEKLISAVESSVRNYVGWHLACNLECKVDYLISDNHIIRCGSDLIVQLPSRYITKIENIKINDADFEDYVLKSNGTLILFDVHVCSRKTVLSIVFYSGLDEGLTSGIKELIANRVSRGLTSTNGVQSESTGGISITYSASWGNTGAGALCDDNREVLAAYKLSEVF